MKLRWRIRRPTPDRCDCASAWPVDLQLEALTHFPSHWMTHHRSAQEQPRSRVRRDLAPAEPARLESALRLMEVRPISRRIPSICPRSVGFPASTRPINSLRIIYWSYRLAMTSAG